MYYPYLGQYQKRLTEKTGNYNPLLPQIEAEGMDKYEHGSPEWNMAMFQYLLDLKKAGLSDTGLVAAEVSLFLVKLYPPWGQDLSITHVNLQGFKGHKRVICKLDQTNECFKIDDEGGIDSIGNHVVRPVRLLRIYK